MQNKPSEQDKNPPTIQDENLGIMVYGNIKIKDLDTGKILVNTRA
jgi:hypothetical protein